MRQMQHTRVLIVFLAFLVTAPPAIGQDATPVPDNAVTVIASGLTNPRGFTWSDDGTLYLALAGTGGDTPGTIDGVEDGIFGGLSSSVVMLEEGCAVPVAEELPSGDWRDAGWVWGVHDVAFLDGELYALSAGGGTDFGVPDQPTALLRLEDDGSTTIVADLSTWSVENPPVFVPPDYNPSGSFFDMEVGTDRIWLSEAVGGRILTVTPEGEVTLVADISDGHPVPTGMAIAPDGGVYVGYLTPIPYVDESSKVIHVAPDGTVTDHWTGLTAVNDIAMGPDGTLYAVEMATGNLEEPPFITPGTGRVVRMTEPDGLEPVVTGIDFPVYLAFGADDALYLTSPAFWPEGAEGQGELLRIDISGELPVSLAGMTDVSPSCTAAGNDSSPETILLAPSGR